MWLAGAALLGHLRLFGARDEQHHVVAVEEDAADFCSDLLARLVEFAAVWEGLG